MYAEIMIGENSNICSSITLKNLSDDCYISNNSQEYIIRKALFENIDILINKSTKEGLLLTKYLENKSNDFIINYIKKLIIKRISISDLLDNIESLKKEAYYKGSSDKAKEIRKALNL